MNDWLPGAVQAPQPGGVTLDTTLPPRFVWHITWDALTAAGAQPDMHAVGNYLVGKEWCPHILWNPFTGEMIQYYPASVGSRALMYNDGDGSACVQIEVFFTPGCVVDGVKYATVADTPLVGFDTLLAWADSLGVPRVWPMGAPQWSGNSRDVTTWNTQAGHYGHCNSPGDDHTDPGPMPDLNREGNDMTPEQAAQLAYIASPAFKADLFTGTSAVEQNARRAFHSEALHTEFEWMGFNGQAQPAGQRHTTSVALALGWADATSTSLAQLINNIPASSLKQAIKLTDGTVTDLASLLAAIFAKPAGVTNVTGAPAVDVDALVARLKAELPPAILADLAAQLTKP
jgi:hypothetical protein